VVLGSDVYEFSWRYQLPTLVTLPLAGVLGGTLIAGRLRARRDPARHRRTGNQDRRASSTTAGRRGEESHQDERAY
jgi:hypothetical protein